MASILNFYDSISHLLNNPYQRPNVGSPEAFLSNFVTQTPQGPEIEHYFLRNPNGLDEISHSIRGQRELKDRLAEIKTIKMQCRYSRSSCYSLLDIIRLHRAHYAPFNTSHHYISQISQGHYPKHGYIPASTKNPQLDKTLSFFSQFGGARELSENVFKETPFADLLILFYHCSGAQPLISTIIDLAAKGYPFALVSLVRICFRGLIKSNPEIPANPNLAILLAEQLNVYETSPVALYERAYIEYESYLKNGLASALTAHQQLVTLSIEAGHRDVKRYVAVRQLLNIELSPYSDMEEKIPELTRALLELKQLPEHETLIKILEALYEKPLYQCRWMEVICFLFWRENQAHFKKLLVSILLNSDDYKLLDTPYLKNFGNQNAETIVKWLSIFATAGKNPLEFHLFVTNEYISNVRKCELILASKTFTYFCTVANNYPELTFSMIICLFDTGMFEELQKLYDHNCSYFEFNLILTRCYIYLFNQEISTAAHAANLHEHDYTNTEPGQIAYMQAYQKLQRLRDMINSKLRSLLQVMNTIKHPDDLRAFSRLLDEQEKKVSEYAGKES